MTSESGKGGEGRGLPVGVEWHYVEGTGGALLRLIKDPDDILAAARADGTWDAWGAGVSRRIRANVHAQRRPDETLLAAAQREAEAALWARDGFEVGEVRGRFVAHGQGFGLPGDWRTKAVRAAPGGHDVDAVRVEAAAEPAPIVEAGPFCEWDLCRAPLSGPPRPGCGSPYQHNADDDGPPPLDAPPAPATKPWREMSDAEQIDATKARARQLGFVIRDPRDDKPAPREPPAPAPAAPAADRMARVFEIARRWYVSPDGSDEGRAAALAEIARVVGEAPPAPAAGEELARLPSLDDLLPGLPEDIATAKAVASLQLGEPHRGAVAHVADACSLLLAERAVLARGFGEILKREDRAFGLRVAYEQGRATERARVAELEAASVKSREQDRTILAGLRALEEQIEPHSLDGETAEATLARLLSAPTGHTVSALLAQVDGAVSNTRTATDDYLTGSRDAYITCARLIREHLGGPPSPLARVAAEVMACHTDHGIGSSLPPADYFASIRDLANGEEATGISSDRDRFEMIGALTLAGMLACDAAPVGGAKGGE